MAVVKSLFLICYLLVLYGMAVGVIKDYVYVSQSFNWWTALQNCKNNHRGFGHITTEQENQRALDVSGQFFSPAWIGLRRIAPHAKTWQWFDGGQPDFTKWLNGEPNDQGTGEECVAVAGYGWVDSNCDKAYPSFCYGAYITLVKENKTWEEALEHCRTSYTDLTFVDSASLLGLLKTETGQTQIASVWTGLRFLDGKWFWVNGVPLGSLVSLPSSPAQPYRCGAYNFNTNVWENRDCNEELNFICYI